MKKILLPLLAIIMSASTASSLNVARHDAVNIKPGVPTAKAKKMGRIESPAINLIPKGLPSRAGADVITEAPEGKLVKMLGNSFTFYIYYDQVTQDEAYGLAYEAVWTEEGDVYLKNPVSMLDWDTYIKGKATDDGITFEFPQPIYTSVMDEESYDFYVDVLEYAEVESPYDPDEYISTFIPAQDTRSITFVKDESGAYVMDGDYMLGVTYEDAWQGYGEMALSLLPFEAEANKVPDGVEFDYTYILADELNGWDHTVLRPIGIGEVDGVTYITGLSDLPGAVITATFDKEANTLTIPSDQFLGEYNSRYIFMMIGEGYSYFDEYWEENMISFDIIADPMVLNYNAEENVFTPVIPEGMEYSYIIFNCGNTAAYPIEYYAVDRIYSQGEISNFTPLDPEVIYVSEIDYIDPEYSYSFEFNVFSTNAEDQMLRTDNIYYNIYVNGELCTFTSEEYPDLAEAGYDELTDIPYDLNVGADIYASGDYHGIALKRQDVETIGVRAVYKDGDTRAESEIVTVTNTGDPVGVATVASGNVVKTEYIDLFGRKTNGADNAGVVLKRTYFENGSVSTEKVMK